jgi:predicted MPP superfamily phosphohydrolase
MDFYCYKSLARNVLLAPLRYLLAAFIGVIWLVEASFFFSFSGFELNEFIYKIAIFSIGATWLVFCLLLLFDAAIWGVGRFSRSRRRALKFLLDIGVLIGAVAYVLRGIWNANYNLILTRRTVRVPNLAEPLNIAVISDVHIGEFLGRDFLADVVARINALNPDAVFIVGDLTDLRADQIGDRLDPLASLKSRFGTFFVAGNHEYYHGLLSLCAKFETLGVRVLRNESVSFGGINLAGVYDLAGFKIGQGEPDFSAALSNLNSDLPTILLAHQPKSLRYLREEELAKIDLMVCGHTHAGQIFPFGVLVWLDQKYIYGLYRIGEKLQLLVSSGVGFWGPPMRIWSKSEIVHLRLENEL